MAQGQKIERKTRPRLKDPFVAIVTPVQMGEWQDPAGPSLGSTLHTQCSIMIGTTRRASDNRGNRQGKKLVPKSWRNAMPPAGVTTDPFFRRRLVRRVRLTYDAMELLPSILYFLHTSLYERMNRQIGRFTRHSRNWLYIWGQNGGRGNMNRVTDQTRNERRG